MKLIIKNCLCRYIMAQALLFKTGDLLSNLKLKFVKVKAFIFFLCFIVPYQTMAHPHVFVDAHLIIHINEEGKIDILSQRWVFDPLFSSGVILDFDKNGNRKLDPDELLTVGNTIKTSLADYDFFQSVSKDSKPVSLLPPKFIKAEMVKMQFVISFDIAPKEPFALEKGHKYSFSLYDPTFYVAVDFHKKQNLVVTGMPAMCDSQIIRPDSDKILSQDLSKQAEDFFNNPQNSFDLAASLATRLDVTCD